MATATVYTIKDNIIVDQFDCDYNYAIGEFFGKANIKGTYFIARKGVKIPYQKKNRILRNVLPSKQDQEQSP